MKGMRVRAIYIYAVFLEGASCTPQNTPKYALNQAVYTLASILKDTYFKALHTGFNRAKRAIFAPNPPFLAIKAPKNRRLF